MTDHPYVGAPVTIGTLQLPHRVVMGSMHLNRETGPAEDLAAFYVQRVRGGAGLIITGGCAVSPVGAGGPGYTLARDPEHGRRWHHVVEAVHDAGGLIALQLFHAGRYALLGGAGLTPVAPSAVYSRFSRVEPVALDDAGIAATVADFAAAAHWAEEIGFDAVEVMASEGYLINQFASPVTNQRTDSWGGDAARRQAFPVAVATSVRAATTVPMIIRMSGADLVPGAPDADEVDALAHAYVAAGADALDIGIGWHESRVPTVQSLVPHGAWIDVAARIRASLRAMAIEVPVITANRVNTLDQAEEIVSSGRADLVSMARPFLADPAIMIKSLTGRAQLVNTCIGCNEACIDRSFGAEPVSCLVNPRAGRERELPADGAQVARRYARRVAVVGAGPAGMEAARTLAAAGVTVELFDAGPRIGGQFLLAAQVPGKADFGETVRYFEHELDRLGVRIHLGTTLDDPTVLAGFAHTVVATGVHPRRVVLPGPGHPQVIDYVQAFADPTAVGRRVAVVGAGGIAVDLAHLLATPGDREITIMRRNGSVGAGIGITTRWAVLQEIRRSGVRTLTGVSYRLLGPDGVHIEAEDGPELIAADTVILAVGQESRRDLADELAATGMPHTLIGGAASTDSLNAVRAFAQGLGAGLAVAQYAS